MYSAGTNVTQAEVDIEMRCWMVSESPEFQITEEDKGD